MKGFSFFQINIFLPFKVEEEEAWINEKTQLLTVPDYGDNMAAAQGLLKKHDAFETDLTVHRDRCAGICGDGNKLIDDGNYDI